MKQQDELMIYDPATKASAPYPSHAAQWRKWHGQTAWIFNPWSGTMRDARDIGTDPFGILILPRAGKLGDACAGQQKVTGSVTLGNLRY